MLATAEENGDGYVSVEFLRCGKQALVEASRIAGWNLKLRETPHGRTIERCVDPETRGAGPPAEESEAERLSRGIGSPGCEGGALDAMAELLPPLSPPPPPPKLNPQP